MAVGEEQFENLYSYIAYEYLSGDSLLKKLLNDESQISEDQSLAYFKQILLSLDYLHEKVGYAH
jgi:serine/threonine protein kinase